MLSSFHKHLLAALLAVVSISYASAISFKSQSELASGHWVKVKVDQAGIHQISYDQLCQWGLNPENVTVYGRGGASYLNSNFSAPVTDDLTQTYSIHTSDGRVLFYAEADRNYSITYDDSKGFCRFSREISTYADYGVYFLTDSRQPLDLTPSPYNPEATIVDTHFSVLYEEKELENNFMDKGEEKGAVFLGDSFVDGPINKSFHLTDLSKSNVPIYNGNSVIWTNKSSFGVSFVAKVNNIFQVDVAFPNSWTAATPTITKIYCYLNKIVTGRGAYITTLNTSLTDAECASVDFDYTVSPKEKSFLKGVGAIDYVSMIYPRWNNLQGHRQLEMNYVFGNLNDGFSLNVDNDATQVWNISDIANIRPLEVVNLTENYAVCSFDTPQNGLAAKRFIAFNPSVKHPSVELVGQVATQNIHALPTPNLLIITTDEMYPHAEQLAQIHRGYQGIDVVVLPQEQIFNEFSSGTPAAHAYRLVAKMFYDRDPLKFRNLLLYGSGLWDNRGIINPVDRELLLTYQDENVDDLGTATIYTADTYFGMLSTNYSHSNITRETQQIGVGRIPARSGTEAMAVNAKIERYLKNPPSPLLSTVALMASDAGDENAHYNQSEQACELIAENNPAITIVKAHRAGFTDATFTSKPLEIIKNRLIGGVGLFGYSGHGSKTGFTWTSQLVNITSYDTPPFCMLSTCDAYIFPHMGNGIAENMLFKEDGGAIGVVGAMCSVYLPYNQYYNLAVVDAWSKARYGDTFGDLLCAARNNLIQDYRNESGTLPMFLNTMCYNYAGDPAVPVPAPAFSTTVKKINESAEAASSFNIQPLVPFRIDGAVIDDSNHTVSSFNGTVTVTIYDTPLTAQTRPASDTKYNLAYDYTIDCDILARACAEVKDGLFSIDMIVPEGIRGTGACSAVIIAEPAEGHGFALGRHNGLALLAHDIDAPGQVIADAPSILELYIGSTDFANGSIVAPKPTVKAIVSAEAGISFADSRVGHSIRPVLDGSNPLSANEYSIQPMPDGCFEINIPLRSIVDGTHNLSLTVTDNQGLRTDRTISFTVGEGALGYLTFDEDALPARSSLTFNLEADTADSAASHRLVIEDISHNCVFSANVTFPYEWNLTDNEGQPVEEGFYNAYATFTGSASGHTPRTQITIIR